MGIQVNLSVIERSSQLLHAVGSAVFRQFVGKVFGVVCGAHERAHRYETTGGLLHMSPMGRGRAYTGRRLVPERQNWQGKMQKPQSTENDDPLLDELKE